MKRVFFGYLGIFALGISFLTAYAPFEREPGLSNQRGVQEIGLSVPDTILEDRGWQDVNEATLGADLIAGAYWTPTVDFSGGTKYYFDPDAPAGLGDGSISNPFSSVGYEIACDSTFVRCDSDDYVVDNTAKGPVVGPGDVCVLLAGNHGKLHFNRFYFSDYVAFVGAGGVQATFDYIEVRRSRHFYFENLKANSHYRTSGFWAESGATESSLDIGDTTVIGYDTAPWFATVGVDTNGNGYGPNNVVFNDCDFVLADESVSAEWSGYEWNQNFVNGIQGRRAYGLHVQDCDFESVGYGVRAIGTGSLDIRRINIINNAAINYCGGAWAGAAGDSIYIAGNFSRDQYLANKNHIDAIQGYAQDGNPVNNYIITGNMEVTVSDPSRNLGEYLGYIDQRDAEPEFGALTAYAGSGIGLTTEGMFHDVEITNNIVYSVSERVEAGWAGAITVNGGSNVLIANNTTLGRENGVADERVVIKVTDTCTDCVVANNITGIVSVDSAGVSTTATNNLAVVQDYASVGFVDYVADGYPLTHDLHLSATSPAIRAGSSTYAPATDYAGDTRPDKVYDDIGAYVYDDPDNSTGAVTLALNNRGADYVNINWSGADADVDYYAIYRDDAESGTPVLYDTNITDEFYADSNVAADTTYTYSVAAIDSSGNSALSNEVVATKDTSAPSAIADLGVTNYYEQIDLSWSAVAASDLDYYNLYRDSEGRDIGSPVVDESDLFDTIAGGTESYTDTNVSTAGDSTYFYRVAAVDSSGNVATLSNVASATPEGTPLAFSAFAAATPTIADTTASRTAEMTLSSATINRAAAFAIKFWDAESAEPDTGTFDLESNWNTPAATDWADAYDTGISVPVATSDTSVTLSWDDVTGETSYLLERNVSGAGWTTVAEPAADATSYEDAGAPRGELNYRIRAIDSAGPDTSAVTLVDSLFYNEAVRVYARAYAIEHWDSDPTASSVVSGLWTSEALGPADTTPPDTTDVLADVPTFAIAWGDTTNTNAHLTATVDASASDEPLMAFSQIKVAYDGSWTPADTTGNWWPATATEASFVDTVYSGATMATIAADTIYWRAQLRDMESTPNVSAFIGANDGDWRWDTLARASAGDPRPSGNVNSWAQLDSIRYDLSGTFTLGADLDSSSAGWATYARHWVPVGSIGNGFLGSFDGQGYSIKHVSADTAINGLALFGQNQGTIQNLAVLEAEFLNASGISGIICAVNQGYVLNCYTSGNVTPANGAYRHGGLVGSNENVIRNCYSTANVSVGRNGWDVGGLVGRNNAAGDSIINSWASGNVGGSTAGGLLGNANTGSVVVNCGWNDHAGNPTYAIGSSSANVDYNISDDITWFYDATRGVYTTAPAWDFSSGDIWYENATALPSFWGEKE